MNFSLMLFIISSFVIQSRKFQRLVPQEMNAILDFIKYNKSDEKVQKCLLALKGQWYPETMYYFWYCDANAFKPNNPPLSQCSGLDCWENQLTDASRLEIEHIMNKYRQKVAKGICWKWCEKNKRKLIFELRWDRSMEEIAMKHIKSCEPQGSIPAQLIDVTVPGLPRKIRVVRDIVKTSFRSITGLQAEMRLILGKLISENYLDDWDEETWQFKRGHMFDFGCAYLIRRHVNYVTALNETVKSGNVGHFACAYQTILKTREGEELEPTRKTCLKVLSSYAENQYYPPLCRPKPFEKVSKDLLQSSSHFCQPNPESRNNPVCDKSNKYSMKTWKEHVYGLTVRHLKQNEYPFEVECNVPMNLPQPVEEASDNVFNYNCTLKREVVVDANPSTCSGWNCAESQLTDMAKGDILKNLNEARQLIANGECSSKCSSPCKYCTGAQYCDINYLQWHWFLEWKASEKVKNCPTNNTFDDSLVFDDSPFPDPVFYEEITLQFDLPSSYGQMALGETFSTLFWQNVFKDWTKENEFRRGNALWIGCSIVVRPNAKYTEMTINPRFKLPNGIASHMVCIYAALENFKSKRGNPADESCCRKCPKPGSLTDPCNLEYVKNIPPYPHLCTSVSLDITMSCQVNYCSESLSDAWYYQNDGTTIMQHENGSFSAVYRYANAGRRVTCILGILLLLSFLLLLFVSLLMCLYDQREIVKKLPVTTIKPIPTTPAVEVPKRVVETTTLPPVIVKPTDVEITKPPTIRTTRPTTQPPTIKTTRPTTVKPTPPPTIKTTRPTTVKPTRPPAMRTTRATTPMTTRPSTVRTRRSSIATTTRPPTVTTTRPRTITTRRPTTKPTKLTTKRPRLEKPRPTKRKYIIFASSRPAKAAVNAVKRGVKTTRPSNIKITRPISKRVKPSDVMVRRAEWKHPPISEISSMSTIESPGLKGRTSTEGSESSEN